MCEAVVPIGQPTRLPLAENHPWTPDDPALYDVALDFGEDHAECYFGLRDVAVKKDAQGIARVYETDLGVGITGYAGPDGGEDGTPVGTIYIGLFWKGSTQVRKIVSPHGRSQARQDAADEALCMILHAIKE